MFRTHRVGNEDAEENTRECSIFPFYIRTRETCKGWRSFLPYVHFLYSYPRYYLTSIFNVVEPQSTRSIYPNLQTMLDTPTTIPLIPPHPLLRPTVPLFLRYYNSLMHFPVVF